MTRGDLNIYGWVDRMPPPPDQIDAASICDEWIYRTANVPNELAHFQDEVRHNDIKVEKLRDEIKSRDLAIQKFIKINGSHVINPKEDQLRKETLELFDKVSSLQTQNERWAQKSVDTVAKHTLWLDKQIAILEARGDILLEADFPSTLKNSLKPAGGADVNAAASPAVPLSQNAGTSVAHARHPNQHPQKATPTSQAQGIPNPGPSNPASAPATPGAAAQILNRGQRDGSLGAAASNKRKLLTGGLGALPTYSSNLARNPSMAPGTPRANTPVRAGSVGPRQKNVAGVKKVPPQGSRQSGVPRKNKPGKSGLNRVKATKTKNSPSSTNDSELSEPSSTGEEEEDLEEEPADDTKYCTCRSVSYGDMVACDGKECPYEWFHWGCVGLKSNPVGKWYCSVCRVPTSAAA